MLRISAWLGDKKYFYIISTGEKFDTFKEVCDKYGNTPVNHMWRDGDLVYVTAAGTRLPKQKELEKPDEYRNNSIYYNVKKNSTEE